MTEAIISSLFPVIFEKLSSQMFDEYGFLQGTKKEMRKLHSMLSSIQSALEDAEDRNIMNKAVKDWLIKLKDVAYDADHDLLDDYVTGALQHKMEVHDLQGCIMDTRAEKGHVSQAPVMTPDMLGFAVLQVRRWTGT